MIRWTDLAPWEFESLFPGSLTSTFLGKKKSMFDRRLWREVYLRSVFEQKRSIFEKYLWAEEKYRWEVCSRQLTKLVGAGDWTGRGLYQCGDETWQGLHLEIRRATRWSTTPSSKVNLPHAIDFSAKYGHVTPQSLGGTKPSKSTV